MVLLPTALRWFLGNTPNAGREGVMKATRDAGGTAPAW
jgi:hypothetical protein